MDKDTLNIIFVAIALAFIGLTFTLNFFGKKIKNNYWFWSIPSLFFLIYFIVLRFYDAWSNLNQYLDINGSIWLRKKNLTYYDSIVVSKALLLDLCPFVALALPFSLIVDKSRRIAQAISPFCILGGAVTIPFIATSDPSAEISAKFLFLGNAPNQIFFIMHLYVIVCGTMVLSNSRNRTWWNLLDCHIFAALYFGYVCFVSYTTNTTWNVTGINENDWTIGAYRGEYSEVSNILNLKWPNVMIVSFVMAYVFVVGIASINISWKIKQQKKGCEVKKINIKKLKVNKNEKIKRLQKIAH